MKAVLRLEIIGDTYYSRPARLDDSPKTRATTRRYESALGYNKTRPWVAKIIGRSNQFGYERKFMRGQKDYQDANSVGSRGVFCYYPLDSGVYEIHERVSWKRTRRYFIRVIDEKYHEISRDAVEAFLDEQ